MSIGKTFSYSPVTTNGRSSPCRLVLSWCFLLGVSQEKKLCDRLNLLNPGANQPMNSGSFPSGITVI